METTASRPSSLIQSPNAISGRWAITLALQTRQPCGFIGPLAPLAASRANSLAFSELRSTLR